MSRFVHCCAFAALVFCAIEARPAAAAEPVPTPAPYADATTLGGWAETKFSDVLADCMPSSGRKLQVQEFRDGRFKGSPQRVSAIPTVVASGLKLPGAAATRLLPFGANKVTGVFGYVYSGSEKTTPTFANAYFLDIDYAGDKDQIVTPRTGFATYTSDCTGILTSALETNANFALPVASIRSLFSGNIEAKQMGRASVATGTFLSPIVSMWRGSGLDPSIKASGAKFYTAMLFWSFYNTTGRLSDNWLLSDAKGASFYRFLTASNDLTGQASLGGDLSAPFLTAKASVDVSYSREWQAKLQDLEFVIFNTPNAYNYVPMPSLDDVLAVGSGYKGVRVGFPEGQIVQPSTKLKFVEDVDYMPAKFCDDGAWSAVSPLIPKASLSIESAKMVSVDGQSRICRFEISYDPGAFTDATAIAVPFSIVRSDIANAATVAAFSIPAETPTFTRSQYPALTPKVGNVRTWNYSPIQKTLGWTLRFDLDDLGRIRTVDAIRPALSLNCGDLAAPVINLDKAFEGTPPPTSQNKVLKLSVIMDYPGAPPAADSPTMKCELTGPVRYEGMEQPRRFPPGVTIDIPLPP